MTHLKSRLLVVLGILLIGGPGLTAPSTSANADVVLEDGTIVTESISAHTITVPVGASVQYAADVSLSATDSIYIRGLLTGAAQPTTLGRAYDLILSASRSIEVTGAIVAKPGFSGSSATDSTSATGGPGSRGGSVQLTWGNLGSLTLGEGARIESGDGGTGGSATVTAGSASGNAPVAAGGAGGVGGDLQLEGTTWVIYGVLDFGAGGPGGAASATGTSSWPAQEDAGLTATGGDGGSVGTLVLPTGASASVLYNAGKLVGGAGGNGGSATAENPLDAPPGCGQPANWNQHASTLGVGGNGCRGSNANSYGGNGGCQTGTGSACLVGGNGGPGNAVAGDGGTGGRGAHGLVASYGAYPMGGRGGRGGNGGNAFAQGGSGRSATIQGGNGGDAYASGGDSGDGGNGGDGGYSGRDAGSTWKPWSCTDLWGSCWTSPSQSTIVCGHAGNGGGPGEYVGEASATPGQGGAGLIAGSYGNNLGASWGSYSGTEGSAGGYPQSVVCNHALGHGHL